MEAAREAGAEAAGACTRELAAAVERRHRELLAALAAAAQHKRRLLEDQLTLIDLERSKVIGEETFLEIINLMSISISWRYTDLVTKSLSANQASLPSADCLVNMQKLEDSYEKGEAIRASMFIELTILCLLLNETLSIYFH